MVGIINFKLNIDQKKRTLWILILVSLGVLLFSTWSTQNVVVSSQDFLGLLAYLGVGYWIGFVIIVASLTYMWLFDVTDSIFLVIMSVLVLGLYLLAVPIFIQKNASFFVSYYPAGEVKTVLNDHHFDMLREGQLVSYHYWPGMHVITASLMLILDISLEPLLKYVPVLWIFVFVLLSYLYKKSFELSNKQYMLFIWLVLASLWVGQYYYSAQAYAILLYIMLTIFILRREKNIGNILVILISFASLLLFHALTPLAIVFSLGVLLLYNRNNMTLLLILATLYLAFYLYLSPKVFDFGVRDYISQVINFDLYGFYKSPDFQETASSLNYIVIHYIRYIYFISYAILIIITGVGFLRRKKDRRIQGHWTSALWLGGLAILLGLQYGTEMQYRVYIFALPVLLPLAISIYPKAKFLLGLTLLFTVLHLPAHYGSASSDQTIDQELAGAKYLALEIKPREAYSYRFYPYVRYYDPSNLFVPVKTFIPQYKNKPDLKTVKYISDSFQSNNYMKYVFDKDPVRDWLNQYQKDTLKIYDNGKFETYQNLLFKKG